MQIAASVVPWGLAAAAGGSLALALPGPGLTPLVLLFPALLLEALERSRGPWQAVLLGWLAGIVHWSVATSWVVPVMDHYGGLPAAVAVVCLLAMAAILGATWAVSGGLVAVVPHAMRPWMLAAAFVAMEASRQLPPLGFPWNPVAATLWRWPGLLQSLPVWGAAGLGWALLLLGGGLWGVIRRPTRWSGAAAVTAAAVLTAAASLVTPVPTSDGPPLRLGVIQPNTGLEVKWDHTRLDDIVELVWAQTRQAADAGAEVVLWPESAVPAVLDTDPGYRRAVTDLAEELDVTIVLNSIGLLPEGYANSAYVVTSLGVASPRYDKVHLVPFGEYVPAWARFAFTEGLVREVGSFTPGETARPLPARAPLGMLICYEVVFGDHVADSVRRGAEILATVTNDSWYGYSWAPHQHLAQAVLRSVETRRWLARAALTGVSLVVDPLGRVTSRLDLGEQGVLVETVQPSTLLTPRVAWGDWWALLCTVAATAMLVAVIPRLRRGGSH